MSELGTGSRELPIAYLWSIKVPRAQFASAQTFEEPGCTKLPGPIRRSHSERSMAARQPRTAIASQHNSYRYHLLNCRWRSRPTSIRPFGDSIHFSGNVGLVDKSSMRRIPESADHPGPPLGCGCFRVQDEPQMGVR